MSTANRGADAAGDSPIAGELWYHVVINTYGSWIRGDERGFRDHDHRISSTGTYKSPPPPEEHRGLRDWVRRNMRQGSVTLRDEHLEVVGRLLHRRLIDLGSQVVVIAVSREHVHLLARLPRDGLLARARIGHAKRYASHQMRSLYPGTLWGKRCSLKAIRDYDHHARTYAYILDHRLEGAWVWSFRDSK